MDRKISVEGIGISIVSVEDEDYINLTDIVKGKGDDTLLYSWLRNRNTVEFLGLWEQINNPEFSTPEFEKFRSEAGLNSFTLSPAKWIQSTGAIGVVSRAGRSGGTYAHKDIALEFCTWLSPAFKLYFIKEFQRLKQEEGERNSLEWNLNRTLSKVNYRIHTDAVMDNIIPPKLEKSKRGFIYANEADLLNKALFGMTAKEWQQQNPNKQGNIRDNASVSQLLVLANLESLSSVLINRGIAGPQRLQILNETAINQMVSLAGNTTVKRLAQAQKPLDNELSHARQAKELPIKGSEEETPPSDAIPKKPLPKFPGLSDLKLPKSED